MLESVAVHRWYYKQNAWYDEYLHYANLLVPDDRGAWGKRLPVLLTLGVLLAVTLGAGHRRGTAGRSGRLLGQAAGITALSLAALALAPTKWVNHFGAVAAPATVLLAIAMVRSPLPRRAGTATMLLRREDHQITISVPLGAHCRERASELAPLAIPRCRGSDAPDAKLPLVGPRDRRYPMSRPVKPTDCLPLALCGNTVAVQEKVKLTSANPVSLRFDAVQPIN